MFSSEVGLHCRKSLLVEPGDKLQGVSSRVIGVDLRRQALGRVRRLHEVFPQWEKSRKRTSMKSLPACWLMWLADLNSNSIPRMAQSFWCTFSQPGEEYPFQPPKFSSIDLFVYYELLGHDPTQTAIISHVMLRTQHKHIQLNTPSAISTRYVLSRVRSTD